ncbi:uncharacterized protein [Asterias amurensis]|uniref:uncharacterized protein n=1 Tax=Asterias amurensis TaxID=7602 RepID=UPI003AB81DD6
MTAENPRFALLTEEELKEMIELADSPSTKRSLKYTVNILSEYCNVKNTTLSEVDRMNPAELDTFLRRFYMEVRQVNGDIYCKKSLQTIRYGIQRHFKDRETNSMDIVIDKAFERSNQSFKATLVNLKKLGKGCVQHKNPITPEDMDKINASPRTDINTPAGLQNKVFIDVMMYHCNRGRENIRDLKKSDFEEHTDSKGLSFITKRDQLTKNSRENDDNKSQAGVMYEIPGNPRCPVRTFRLYKQKLHPNCDFLWQRPRDNASTGISDEVWYCNIPVGKNTLCNKLKVISIEAKCSRVYTNHCFRATSVTILDNAGFEARDIMTVSGHHSESSIKNYSRTSESKKRKMSSVLSAAMNMEESVARPSSSHSAPATITQSPTHQPHQQRLSQFLTSSQEESILSAGVLQDIMNVPTASPNSTTSTEATTSTTTSTQNLNINDSNRSFRFHGCQRWRESIERTSFCAEDSRESVTSRWQFLSMDVWFGCVLSVDLESTLESSLESSPDSESNPRCAPAPTFVDLVDVSLPVEISR